MKQFCTKLLFCCFLLLSIFSCGPKEDFLPACRHNNISDVKKHISKGVDVNKPDTDGSTPLMIAVVHGYLDLADLLIHNGANVNQNDEDGHNALYISVVSNNLSMVKLLINAGANVNNIDKTYFSPLFAGIINDVQPQIIKELIAAGADVNIKVKSMSFTPLLYCAYSGKSAQVVQMLIDAGASLEEKNNMGMNALTMAATNNPNVEILKTLLATNIEKQNTALLFAVVGNENPEIIREMIKAGFKFDKKLNVDNIITERTNNANNFADDTSDVSSEGDKKIEALPDDIIKLLKQSQK